MKVLPYGDRAVLVTHDDLAQVLAWAEALRAAAEPAVAEVVPAAATVLVVAAEDAAADDLRAAVGRVPVPERTDDPPAEQPEQPETVEISVTYDGPDLDEVASLTGLSTAEVVEAHTGSPWRVAFGGFAPGFGYLVGGDPRLEVPRRSSPRQEVPAGAVGLAGPYAGVYPRASPGGWQLIGTTTDTMWDPDRQPPALLRPGAEIRFVRA